MINSTKKILVTGSAGFIGFHLANRLIHEGFEVVGLDVVNDYYDPKLKFARLEFHGIDTKSMKAISCNPLTPSQLKDSLSKPESKAEAGGDDNVIDSKANLPKNEIIASSLHPSYSFLQADLADHHFILEFMKDQQFDYVINLAAQAGVRYSLENPLAYTHSNIDGFLSILEGCRYSKVKHLIYASTSSVYGLNTSMPLSECQPTEHPMALYAATKKANEMMAHSYSHLYDLPTTGLRFFTVYGPWGRPDMALFLFTDAILKDEPIKVFNHGKMIRDFTYVDDIVESILRLIPKPATPNPKWDGDHPEIPTSSAPYQVFNIGNSSPVPLMRYIEALESALGKKAQKNYMDIQAGDVPATHADTHRLEQYVNFRPTTSVEDGVKKFVEWYLDKRGRGV